jgi:hypothetical protein
VDGDAVNTHLASLQFWRGSKAGSENRFTGHIPADQLAITKQAGDARCSLPGDNG